MDDSEPSNSDLVERAAKAIWKWSRTGFATVDDEVFQRRLAVCLACPNMMKVPKRLIYRATSSGDADARMCVLCGCIIAHKARLASETCPDQDSSNPELNRWGERLAPFREPPVANE